MSFLGDLNQDLLMKFILRDYRLWLEEYIIVLDGRIHYAENEVIRKAHVDRRLEILDEIRKIARMLIN